MTYEQLALIADLYIPFLLIAVVICIVKGIADNGLHKISGHITATLSSIFIAYSIMFLDIKFKIWPAFYSDYSTHTALALVFVSYFLLKSKMQMGLSLASLIGYFYLMIYQKYHTATDIISTSLVVLPLFVFLQIRGQKAKIS